MADPATLQELKTMQKAMGNKSVTQGTYKDQGIDAECQRQQVKHNVKTGVINEWHVAGENGRKTEMGSEK